jgi:hypothetical protein
MAEAEVLRKIQEEKDRKEKEAKLAFQAALDREKKLAELAIEQKLKQQRLAKPKEPKIKEKKTPAAKAAK